MDSIREHIKSVVQEAREDQEAIKLLAYDILKIAAESNVEHIKDHAYIPYMSVKIADIPNKEKYGPLEPMLNQYSVKVKDNIGVSFLNSVYFSDEPIKPSAQYKHINAMPSMYNARFRKIVLIWKPNHIEYLKNDIELMEAMYGEDGYTSNFFTIFLQKYFLTSLMHELRHAYDDFRSFNKMFHDKEHVDYRNSKETIAVMDRDSKEVKKKELELHKKYLNLPSEIWARFTEAVNNVNTRFFKVLGDIFYKDKNGNSVVKYEMNPQKDVIKDVLINMNGWDVLDEKMRRRLIKAIINMWYETQEFVEERNQDLTPA